VAVTRRNPLPIQVQMPPDQTLANINILLPVLTLQELDHWLANHDATLRYVDATHFLYRQRTVDN
jgi:hypothetical protein